MIPGESPREFMGSTVSYCRRHDGRARYLGCGQNDSMQFGPMPSASTAVMETQVAMELIHSSRKPISTHLCVYAIIFSRLEYRT